MIFMQNMLELSVETFVLTAVEADMRGTVSLRFHKEKKKPCVL